MGSLCLQVWPRSCSRESFWNMPRIFLADLAGETEQGPKTVILTRVLN